MNHDTYDLGYLAGRRAGLREAIGAVIGDAMLMGRPILEVHSTIAAIEALNDEGAA
jgi:hypothetical protein